MFLSSIGSRREGSTVSFLSSIGLSTTQIRHVDLKDKTCKNKDNFNSSFIFVVCCYRLECRIEMTSIPSVKSLNI